jgi:hypothetical protein
LQQKCFRVDVEGSGTGSRPDEPRAGERYNTGPVICSI